MGAANGVQRNSDPPPIRGKKKLCELGLENIFPKKHLGLLLQRLGNGKSLYKL